MRRLTAALMSMVLLLSTFIGYIPAGVRPVMAAETIAGDYVEGEAIVCVKQAMSLFSLRPSAEDVNPLLSGAESLMDVTTGASTFSMRGASEREVIMLVKSDELSTMELIAELEKLDEVVFAEPNYIVKLASTDAFESNFTDMQWAYDPREPYGMQIDGWNTDAPNVDPNQEIVVAVVDTGVDYEHPDLNDVMWKATPEQIAVLGGGEYGFNAGGADEEEQADPMDTNSHGTHCAGIIAAEWNDEGISGGAKGAKIMAVRVMDNSGLMLNSYLVSGLDYVKRAREIGEVNVVATNDSWGGDMSGMQAVDRAFRALGEAGVVNLVASGNDTLNIDVGNEGSALFKDNPYVVMVNASDETGNLANFSNYGRTTTDVAAPGYRIYSTVPRSLSELVDLGKIDMAKIASGDTDTFEVGGKDERLFYMSYYEDNIPVMEITDELAYRGARSLKLETLTLEETNAEGKVTRTVATLDLKAPCKADMSSHPAVLAFQGYGAGIVSGMTCQFSFSCKTTDTDEDGDAIWTDSMASGNFAQIQGDGWHSVALPIPENADFENFEAKILFVGAAFTDEGLKYLPVTFYIDDMMLLSEDYKVPYGYKNGTSMAAPAVAAEAAILAAFYPDDWSDKIAARIIGSVIPVDSHKGKSISGGVVSVRKALQGDTVPVLNEAGASDEGLLVVSGFFFGDATGSIWIDDVELTPEYWSDELITAYLPEGIARGNHDITITSDKGSGYQMFEINLPDNLYTRLELAEDILDFTPRYMQEWQGKLYAVMSGLEPDTAIFGYDPASGVWTEIERGIPYYLDDFVPTITADGKLISRVMDMNTENEDVEMLWLCYDLTTGETELQTELEGLEGEEGFQMLTAGQNTFIIMGDDDWGMMYKLDWAKGRVTEFAELPAGAVGADAVVDVNGNIYLLQVELATPDDTSVLENTLYRVTPTGEVRTLWEKVPFTGLMEGQGGQFSLALTDEGIRFTGPFKGNEKGVEADTWVINIDNGKVTPTGKIISTAQMAYIQSAICNGNWYTMALTGSIAENMVFVTEENVYTEKKQTTSSGGGGGGGGGSTGYEVAVDTGNADETAGGTVSISKDKASENQVVTITVKPDDGYKLENLVVKDKNGNEITLTDKGNGQYTFIMPKGKVDIVPTFVLATVNEELMDVTETDKPTFIDMQNHWAKDYVEKAAEMGIVSGLTSETFAPDALTTRGQITTLLWRIAGKPAPAEANRFADVAAGSYYEQAVQWAAENGIAAGLNEMHFGPEENLTREQLATFLYRYAKAEDKGFTGMWAFRLDYSDVAEISDWSYEALCWMTMNGIISGRDDGSLDPKGQATRAEMTVMLMKFIEVMEAE